MQRKMLVEYLDQLLNSANFRDACPNGLQVEGRDTITCLASACSASRAAIEAAVKSQADALLVHHGILWGKEVLPISGLLKPRLAALLAADCSLIAYHLPLDAHLQWGNNAVILQALGCSELKPFASYHGQDIGCYADLVQPLAIDDLSQRLTGLFQHPVFHCPGSGKRVSRLGVVSGGGQSLLLDAAAIGCQAFITGEVSEQSWHEAAESGCHCLAVGHHASESIAIHQLAAHICAQQGLRHIALDIPNPI